MKKIIYTVFCLLMFVSFVHAEENRLYFTDNGDRLYYDTDLYDEDIFISNMDMIPGKEYKSELSIKNETSVKYKLYLKVNELKQSELAKELIDNIEMIVYLDGNLIYDGYANGLDYSKNKDGVNLQNAVFIGEYDSNKVSKLEVITKLANDYANTENDSISRIEWRFYAEYEDEVLPINPDTGSKFNIKMLVILLILLLVAVIIYFVSRKVLKNN